MEGSVGGMSGFERLGGNGTTSSSSSLSKSITSTALLGFCGDGVTSDGTLTARTTGEAKDV
jgi:hypothetical protein